MALAPTDFTGLVPIDSYGPGFFRVGGEAMQGNLLISPLGAIIWAGFDDPDPILALAGKVDVIFIGMGAEIAHPPAGFAKRLEEAGLMVEAMATPPAARTYNVLLSEGRRIAAALIAMPGTAAG